MSVDFIVVLGVNHKTAPVAVRELLACGGDNELPLRRLIAIPYCDECCFLSTCNRVEVIFLSSRPEAAIRAVRGLLFENSGLSDEEAARYTYLHQGQDAITHLFRVAASLDSMIVGEPQILGQLKEAFRQASEVKTTGVTLNRLMHKAFSVAKRIRTETNIGSSAVSISYAAVELAKKIFGELKGKKVMLVGAGEMAELAAEHLINQGVAGVVVANRTLDRALNLARRFHGSAVALTELVQQLEDVDILISSTGAPGLILTRDEVRPVMRQRRNKPLFLIDIAVPRDLDPELNKLENVYLYDIDDLTNVVEGNKAERDKEAARAGRIVDEEVLKFLQWLDSMQVSPTIVALRQKTESLRDRELAKTLSQLRDLPDKDRRAVEMLATSLMNKFLHEPMIFLKTDCPPEEKQRRLELFHRLFGLDRNHVAGKDEDEER